MSKNNAGYQNDSDYDESPVDDFYELAYQYSKHYNKENQILNQKVEKFRSLPSRQNYSNSQDMEDSTKNSGSRIQSLPTDTTQQQINLHHHIQNMNQIQPLTTVSEETQQYMREKLSSEAPASKTKPVKQKRRNRDRVINMFSKKSLKDSDNFNENSVSISQEISPKKNSRKRRETYILAENKLSYVDLDVTEHNAKYVILDKEECETQNHVKDVVDQIFKKSWGLKKPKLLISVTGSAQNFQMKPNLRTVFRRGIAQAAKSTQAWILTGGTHSGVMKHVGEAMHEYSAWQDDNDGDFQEKEMLGSNRDEFLDIPVIGFATYETLSHSTRQPIDDAGFEQDRDIQIPGSGEKGTFLDRNHSHFVLVSSQANREAVANGTNPSWAQETTLWAQIEEHIIQNWNSDRKSRTSSLTPNTAKKPIPALLISIQGGPGTLDTAIKHLQKNIPLVAIRSSGGWSDIICDLCAKNLQTQNDFIEFDFAEAEKVGTYELYKGLASNGLVQNIYCETKLIDNKPQPTLIFKTSGTEQTPDPKFNGQFTGSQALIASFIIKKLEAYKMCIKDAIKQPININHITSAIKVYDDKKLITIFELTKKNNELDTAMMKAVLSAQQYQNQDSEKINATHQANEIENTKISKIHLAIDYDKAELIREELFQDDAKPLTAKQLGDIFDQAIAFRKPKFIDLVLDMDFDYKAHITKDKLMGYYESLPAQKNNLVLFNIFKNYIPATQYYKIDFKNFHTLKDVLHEIEKYVFGPEFKKSFENHDGIDLSSMSYVRSSMQNEDRLEFPLRHLIFWAAILGDFKIVAVLFKHLAKYEGGGIIAALALATIFKKGSKTVHAIEQSTILKQQSIRYETLAVGILNKAYQKANIKSALIVGLPSSAWGNMTPLKMAIQSHARNFVSQQGFQEWLRVPSGF